MKGTPTKGEVSLHADESVGSLSDSNVEGSVILAVCFLLSPLSTGVLINP